MNKLLLAVGTLCTIVIILYFSNVIRADTKSTPETGTLSATVTWWPQAGPRITPGSLRHPRPAAGIAFSITGSSNPKLEFSVVTDNHGKFRIKLPIGRYQITTGPRTAKHIGRQWFMSGDKTIMLPTAIIITKGRDLHLDITMDSGIR
jgi:hypothetical protein